MANWKIPTETASEIAERQARALREALDAIEIPAPEPESSTPEALAEAVAAIAGAHGQAAILRSLLDGATALGARAALFVVRDSGFEGWEGRGFENDPGVGASLRGNVIDRNDRAMGQVLESGEPVTAGADREAPVPSFGQSASDEAMLLPVIVRGKVAGIVYADAAGDAPLDRDALRVLVTAAALAVERLAPAAPRTAPGPSPAAARPAPATPPQATAPPTEAATPAGPPTGETSIEIEPEVESGPPAAPEPPPSDDPAVEDARRFARLLVEEICLYNGEGVEIGRTQRDLASRFADEIDRARAMYEQRVSAEVRAKGDFFQEALVRVLAAGDAGALGSLAQQSS